MERLAQVARQAIEAYVQKGVVLQPPSDLVRALREQAGVFVSIKGPGDSLRGCMGTVMPTCETIVEEVITNAIRAASMDPRFPPVWPAELPGLRCSVDVLGQPFTISSLAGHDPRRHGLIVESGERRGLLLPAIEGIDTAELQELLCRQKAGIRPHEPVTLYRFEAIRYT